MLLDIGPLKSGVIETERSLSATELELDETEFTDLRVRAIVDREGDRVFVRLEVAGTAHLICDRTLVPFDRNLNGSYAVLFVPDDRVHAHEGEEDDVRGYEPETGSIEIGDLVRDTLMLSMPLRRVAPGADDIEIQTRFGERDEDEVDPRWEALRSLKADSGDRRTNTPVN